MRRVLDASATIVDNTNCEYLCWSGGSHTSDYGVVHNPHLPGFTSDGSSSGNAVAIVRGEADFALGTDQAGSIPVPASYSGLVRRKPTTLRTAPPLRSPDDPIAVQVRATNDIFGKTAAFNSHPALSLPCGMVDALPVGMMLVGRHYDEATLFRIAHAYELS